MTVECDILFHARLHWVCVLAPLYQGGEVALSYIHPDPLPALYVPVLLQQRGGNGRGAMPFLMSLALEPGIVRMAWIDNASVQFPLNIYATKGCSCARWPM